MIDPIVTGSARGATSSGIAASYVELPDRRASPTEDGSPGGRVAITAREDGWVRLADRPFHRPQDVRHADTHVAAPGPEAERARDRPARDVLGPDDADQPLHVQHCPGLIPARPPRLGREPVALTVQPDVPPDLDERPVAGLHHRRATVTDHLAGGALHHREQPESVALIP